MAARSCALCAVLALVCIPEVASAQRLVYLVRHAHKEQEGDALTHKGKAQASTLAHVLKDAGITSVYTSQFVRTEQTAAELLKILENQGVNVRRASIPLSEDLLADPASAMALATYADRVVSTLRNDAGEEIVLLVGHDITVPAVVERLGGRRIKIERDEFTHLFIVVPKLVGGRGSGMVHIPDYSVLRTAFSGDPKANVREAVQSAIENARRTADLASVQWSLKEVFADSERYTATIALSKKAGPEPPARETPEFKFFKGNSSDSDLSEAVQDAVSNALPNLPSDYVSWRLRGVESDEGGLSATIAVMLPTRPKEKDQAQTKGRSFTGTSTRGDVYEAIERLVEEAQTALQTPQVHLEITRISGASGGFMPEKTARVSAVTKSRTAEPPK